MRLVIGLTGGIGCGKSLASQYFSELGICVIDTDVIARTITQSNGRAIPKIKNDFGISYLTKNGALDREKMRQLIFSDKNARLRLEKILHPIILSETVQQIACAHSPYVVVVIPLLFETKDYDTIVHRILVIDCDEQQQISRVMARSNLSEQQVKSIMATQVARKERQQRAHDIITNNQDTDYLKTEITKLHSKYLSLSNQCIDADV